MQSNPTLQYGEYDLPEPTGKVYVVMKSTVTGTEHLYVKQHKTTDGWLELTPETELSNCWAFSRQGAKKIIERYKKHDYKVNFEKGLVEFKIMDEYPY